MVTKQDWKGYYNVLKVVEYNEEAFTDLILYSFIKMYYPNTDINELQYIEKIEGFQDALEDILIFVKDWDDYNKEILKGIK